MRQSGLFIKTQRNPPKDEESKNAILLERGGFVQKQMAGVYNFLPLGLRVLGKIENIVREEMNSAGGIEILMSALQPKENWEATGRWKSFDALLKTESKFGGKYALGPTHEEIIYPLLKNHLESYQDLPIAAYQIQTKFRDEKRAKSGLLRGREFRMKDMYSFHEDDRSRDAYYEKIKMAYKKIFARMELDIYATRASGGTFSELSIEFQTPCEAGEDIIYVCEKCKEAVNKEIAENSSPKCPNCSGSTEKIKAIEVGNIFPLKQKFAEDFDLTFKKKSGEKSLVSAGCYGLGTTRALGAIAEVKNDQYGIIWPKSVAPFAVHLVYLKSNAKNVKAESDKIYEHLSRAGTEVLYDDRDDKSAGEKFAESDLLGIPLRVVVSDRTLEKDSAEIKARSEKNCELVKIGNLTKFLSA